MVVVVGDDVGCDAKELIQKQYYVYDCIIFS